MKKVEILREKIDGDTAVVTVRGDEGEEDIALVKVDGVWKLVLPTF